MRNITDIKSEIELKSLFESYQCKTEIEISSYRKTRYVDDGIYNNLVRYRLNFEPFTRIAKSCSMRCIDIMRSEYTNRFYIGFLNTGGHRAVCEIRPVRLADIFDYSYINDMFANHAQKLDWGIDINENYEI